MRPKVGIGIIVLHENKVLMAKRRNSHGDGTWGFPGGHLEFNETVSECTCRELFEETGLIMGHMKIGPFHEIFFKEENKHYLNIFTIVTSFDGTAENKEPEKNEFWNWVDIEKLPSPLFLPIEKIAKSGSIKTFLKEALFEKSELSYLTAPYAHPDPSVRDERFEIITKTTGSLIEGGTFVFSPIIHNTPLKNLGELSSPDSFVDYNRSMITLCAQMIILKLPGWEKSQEVQAEITYAKEKHIPIVEMYPLSMV